MPEIVIFMEKKYKTTTITKNKERKTLKRKQENFKSKINQQIYSRKIYRIRRNPPTK